MQKLILTLFILVSISLNVPGEVDAKPPIAGETLSDFSLPVPQDVEQRNYLGITATDVFTIPQIKSEIVIIEIFNMY